MYIPISITYIQTPLELRVLGAHEKNRVKECTTPTQLAKARHLHVAGLLVLLFLDSLFATPIANVTANSTTVSMASTPVYNSLKTRKIHLETEKLFTTSTSCRCSE